MDAMRQVFVGVAYVVLAACLAHAQSNSRPLLRMERLQPGELVCALVNDDGGYRLEKMYRAKNEMYLGTIDPAGMDLVRKLMTNDQLKTLAQTDIHKPLVSDTLDDLYVSIWRDRGWQELQFSSPESRKPFKESVDPLIRWFQNLQKQRPSARSVDTQTRCMPPPQTRVVMSATKDSTPASPMVPATPSFLFRVSSTHAYHAHIDSACTVVFDDGRFHAERGGQDYMAARHNKIGEGQVNPEAVQELKDILNAPELKSSLGNPDVSGHTMQEGTVTNLSIPRENGTQILLFMSSFNTMGRPNEVGGRSNQTYHLADLKLLEPLTRWVKQHTDEHGAATWVSGQGNDCYPAKPAVGTSEPPH